MKFIGEYILKRKVDRLRREIGFKSLSHAKSVLLVYNCTSTESSQLVRDFARYFVEEGLQVSTIGYYAKTGKQNQKPQDELNYVYFDKKELNALLFPKNAKVKRGIANDYDLLIDLNIKGDFPLEVISSLSKAKFKVGMKNKYSDRVYDLTIASEKKELPFLIEQIKKYLKMINN